MSLTINEKKELLMDSFNIFKKRLAEGNVDFEDLATRIEYTIVKMMKIDIDLGTEMWENILTNYPRIGEDGNDTFEITSGLILYLRNQIGSSKVANTILNNPTIKNIIYNKAAKPDSHIIGYLIDTNNYSHADELLNLVYENKNHIGHSEYNDTFGEFFDFIVRVECEDINSDGAEFIYSWIDRIKAEELKASIKLELIDLL